MANKTWAQAKQLKKDDKNSCSKARQIEGSNDKTNDDVALLIANCQSNNTISKWNRILN